MHRIEERLEKIATREELGRRHILRRLDDPAPGAQGSREEPNHMKAIATQRGGRGATLILGPDA